MTEVLPLDSGPRAAAPLSLGDEQELAPRRSTFDLRYILAAIRSNLLLIGAIIGGALALAVIVTLLQTPRYTAHATIQISEGSTRVLGDKQADTGEDVEVSSNDALFLKTQVDILQSRGLAIRVAQRLKLDSNPRFFAAQEAELPAAGTPPNLVRERVVRLLLNNIKINLPRDSRIVTITYESTDPAISAEIANSWANEFIQSNLQRKFDSSEYVRDFISTQLAQVKQRLEDSERALNAYSRQAGLIHLTEATGGGGDEKGGQMTSVTTSSLAQLNQAANAATAQRIAAQSQLAELDRGNIMASTAVLSSPTVSALQAAKAQTEAELQEERSHHLDDYPTVRAKQAQLASLDRQIAAAAANIRSSVRAQYQAASAQEQQLNGEVEHLKTDTLSEQDRNVQYGMLAREVDTNREIYDGLLQRYKQLNASAGISLSNVAVIDAADQPLAPSSPNLVKNLLAAAIAGVALAAVALFVKDQFDDSIRIPEDVEAKLAVPLLGVVPRAMHGDPEDALTDPKSPIAEAYNSLRGSLIYSTGEGLPHVLLVTSAQPSEGKTTSAYAMASGFARMGKRVLLADADLRRLSLHRRIDYDNERGLSTLLTSPEPAASVFQPSGQPNLTLIPSGPVPPSPTELLSSVRLEEVIHELARQFDVVIFDSPPILGLADSPMISALVDGVVFVVEADRSRHGSLKTALRRLRSMRPIILGAVLTKFDPFKGGNRYSTYYGYEYYQYYQADAPASVA